MKSKQKPVSYQAHLTWNAFRNQISHMIKSIVTAILSLLLSYQALAMPAQVVLMRHGEKPPGDEGSTLSKTGWQRAQALPQMFLRPEFQKFGPPVALYAMDPKKKHGSVRAIQTLAYLSETYHLPINHNYDSDNLEDMVQEVSTDPKNNGKMVVICWGHEDIKDIAKLFGAKIPKWNGDVYDRVYILNFIGNEITSVQDVPERLLPQDSQN